MPLDFLKRKNTPEPDAAQPGAGVAPAMTGSTMLPEEVVAQDFQLKL